MIIVEILMNLEHSKHQEHQLRADELYSDILKCLSEETTAVAGKYLDTEVYTIHIKVADTLEIKEFIVKTSYRGQGYGTALAKKLKQSPMNVTIVACLSPVLQSILKKTGWKQLEPPIGFNFRNH